MISSERAEAIAKENYNAVYRFCLSQLQLDEEAASEVTQEVFLLFLNKCDRLEETFIRAWLYKVTEYKAKEHFSRIKKEERLVPIDFDVEDPDQLPIAEILEACVSIKDEEIEKYKTIVLKGLSKSDQELYRLIYVEKKKHKEIAEELNLTESAVNSRAFRLNKRLDKIIRLMFTPLGCFIIRFFF